MTPSDNAFVWYELTTTDAPAAETFYREVIGWHMADAGLPDRRYTIVSAGEMPIGGVMPMPPDMPADTPPHWIGYIGTADVDAAVTRLQQAGGAVRRPAADIPGVGRFAVVADPHGASFVLFKGAGDPPPSQPAADSAGQVGWHELQAGDLDSAWAFYAGQFGWTKQMAVDMGPMGTYQTFMTAGDQGGGMMTKLADVPRPFWQYYVNVDGINAAAERVRQHGGQVINGPHQVPGGQWIVNCVDPQGALFALVSVQP